MKVQKYRKGLTPHLDDYIEIVTNRIHPVCNEQILLIQYLKKILARDDVVIDVDKINDCIDFIESARHYSLAPVQRFIHAVINGIRYTDGQLVFYKILIYTTRGFGKTSILAEEGLYLTSNRNGIRNYNFDIVANNQDQSKITFDDAYNIITENVNLQKAYYRTKTEIKFIRTNSKIKYYTSNAKTKDGLKPGAIAFDEDHEFEEYSKLKVFKSALGKVDDARELHTTTDGYIRGAVLDDLKSQARDVLNGLDEDIGLFPFMTCIDSYNEWDKEEGWIKANPMLPYLPKLKRQYKNDFKDAKKNAQLKLEFLTKRLNFPMEDTTIVPASREELLEASRELPDLTRCECIGGIDYADTSDFIGVGLLFRKGDVRYWLSHTFIMEESLKATAFNEELLRQGKEHGCYTVLPGRVAQEDAVAEWFFNMAKKYRIKKVFGDRFRIQILKEAFAKKRIPLEEVGSGWVTHNKVAPLVTQLFGHGNIIWGNDPFMRWYTNNVKIVTDQKGNKTYHKIEPIKRKTDGFMALIHALSQESLLPVLTVNYKPRKSYTY